MPDNILGWKIKNSNYSPLPYTEFGACVYAISPYKFLISYFGFCIYHGRGGLVDIIPIMCTDPNAANIHQQNIVMNDTVKGRRMRAEVLGELFGNELTAELLESIIIKYDKVLSRCGANASGLLD